jgi:hypothetical protein
MALVLVTAGCGNRADAVADLQALFPTLAEYGVTNFYGTDECEYIVYERGAFVTVPGAFECDIDVAGPRQRSAFDDQARADLDAIYRESERHGRRIQQAYPEYGPDGSIIGGSFGFEVCRSYIFEPGWSELPEADSETYTAIDADWWEVTCGGMF